MLWKEGLLALGGYLLGSVLFSYLLPLWLAKIDIVERSEDHNPGTVNAFRFSGVFLGSLCLLCDLMKGALPMLMGQRLFGPRYLLLPLVMAAPVWGHATAPWYGFPGGKAIAAAFGVLIGLLPVSPSAYVLAFLYVFFSVVWVIHPNEKRTVVTFLTFVACSSALAFGTGRFDIAFGCLLVSVMPVYKNYTDINRAKEARAGDKDEPEPRMG